MSTLLKEKKYLLPNSCVDCCQPDKYQNLQMQWSDGCGRARVTGCCFKPLSSCTFPPQLLGIL